MMVTANKRQVRRPPQTERRGRAESATLRTAACHDDQSGEKEDEIGNLVYHYHTDSIAQDQREDVLRRHKKVLAEHRHLEKYRDRPHDVSLSRKQVRPLDCLHVSVLQLPRWSDKTEDCFKNCQRFQLCEDFFLSCSKLVNVSNFQYNSTISKNHK